MARLRVATVGTGYFSRFHHDAWRRIENVDLVAVCDLEEARAKACAKEYGAGAAFCHVGQMLETARPDLLDIITPPDTHADVLRVAMAHGVDAVCQKPFCGDLETARTITEEAEAADIRVIVHENFRFQPWYQAIRNELDDGRLGQVYRSTFWLRPGDGQGPDAYLDRQPYFQTMPRFLIHETGIHLIDVFRYLFGDVTAVQAQLARLNPAIAGEDAAIVIAETATGVTAVLDANRLNDHPAQNHRLTMGEMLVEGERGVLRLDGDGVLFFRAHGTYDEITVPYDWNNLGFGGDCVYRLQMYVCKQLRRADEPVNSARQYLKNLHVEEAIYRAASEARRIVIGS
ncbi:MAG: Gfo/Idh/MocA family oxidoreductase [Pseudomonadota bacterium]